MTSDLHATRRAHARAFLNDAPAKGRPWSEKRYAYDYQKGNDMYLCWFDDNAKHTIEVKIMDAIGAYQLRYGMLPNIALVSELDHAPASVAGVPTRIEKRVGRNNVQVGWEG